MSNKYVILLFFSLIVSVSPINSYQPPITIDTNELIYFNPQNSSIAISMFSNSNTQYDVIFYDYNWTLLEIENWINTGEVIFSDDSLLNFTNCDIRGNVVLQNKAEIGFDQSTVDIMELSDTSSLILDSSKVASIKNLSENTVINIIASDSEIDYIENTIWILTGTSEINGLTLYGEVTGVNISMQSTVIKDGYYHIHLDFVTDVHFVNITGYETIKYRFSFYQYHNNLIIPEAKINIYDLEIYEQSNFQYISNLNMTNIRYSYSSNIPIIKLLNSNGTINSMRNLGDNTSIVEIINSQVVIINSEFTNLRISIDGDIYNSNYKITLNDTLIHGNLIWYSLSVLEYNNLTIKGNLMQKVVVSGKNAIWEQSESGFVNYEGGIEKTLIPQSNLFNFKYCFNLLESSSSTLINTSIYDISGYNASTKIYGSVINSTSFDNNISISIYNSIIYGLTISQHSSYSFYRSNFFGNFVLRNGETSQLYFENCYSHDLIQFYFTNITSVSSYFKNIVFYSYQNPGNFQLNFTNSLIDKIDITLNTEDIYNFIFMNSTINFIYGRNSILSLLTLHFYIENSEIISLYNWDWAQVFDLTTVNSTLQTLSWEHPLNLIYYENGIEIIWSQFEPNLYLSSETGFKTIQRRELIDDKETHWENIANVTGDTYRDTTVILGKIYDYKVLNQYSAGFSIAQVVLNNYKIPAKLPLIANITGDSVYYLDVNQESRQIDFQVTILKIDGSIYNVFNMDHHVQYELFQDGKSITDQINITSSMNNIVFPLVLSEGSYLLKVRVSSEIVRYWSDWVELNFELILSTPTVDDTTITTDNSNTDSLPGLVFIQCVSVITVIVFIRRNQKIVHQCILLI